MSKIVYLGYYDTENIRATSPAAVTMMDYIIKCFQKNGKEFVVISPAQAKNGGALSRKEVRLPNNGKIVYLPSLQRPVKRAYISRALRRLKHNHYLKCELIKQLEDGDDLFIYHSLALMNCIRKICKKRNISLIIQNCEIYSDVINNNINRKRELHFLQMADKYIFSTEMLEHKVNTKNKPYLICLGTYQVEKIIASHVSDDKIHIVYAGTLDPRKGGAAAAAAAEFLDERYHIHIIGFGSEAEKNHLLETIAQVSKKTKCTITFDGLKSGEEYIRFIQSCNIGLSTQNPDAAFNDTSFPSKILSYMSNGLKVVSIDIPSVHKSLVGNEITYYSKQNPEQIAKAIMSVDIFNGIDCRRIVSQLDIDFRSGLKELVEGSRNESV